MTKPPPAVLAAGYGHPHADTDSIINARRANRDDVSHQAVHDVQKVLTNANLIRRIQPTGSVSPTSPASPTSTTSSAVPAARQSRPPPNQSDRQIREDLARVVAREGLAPRQAIATSNGHDQVFAAGNGLVEENWFLPGNGAVGGWISF